MKDKRFISDDHIEMIDEEYAKAVGKHPEWPNDAVYAAAIVMKESGELIRAAVQYNMEGGSIEAMEKEAIQTIVTSIRFLNALESYKKALNTGSGVEWSFNAYAREYGFPAVHSECVFITADDRRLQAVIKEYAGDEVLVSIKTESDFKTIYANKKQLFFTIKNQANETNV